jgi:hypothetical protein
VLCPGNTFTSRWTLAQVESADLGHQLFHAAKGSAPDGALRDPVEPDAWAGCVPALESGSSYYVAHLLHEKRIGRELEVALPVTPQS